MYQLPLQITSTYVGPERELTVPWFFRIFQDVALLDAEKIGFTAEKTTSQGLLWVFSRVYVRFHKMPEYLSNITFETVPGARKAFFFPRYGKMKDENGEMLAELSSIWALIHSDTRRVEMHPDLGDADETDGSEIPLPGKVEQKPCSFRYSRRIEYSDLDLNGHLNNVRYLEMLMNIHDTKFYQEKMISELLIQYESEIHEGDVVEVFVDDLNTYVRGIVGDRICFEANLKYASKN